MELIKDVELKKELKGYELFCERVSKLITRSFAEIDQPYITSIVNTEHSDSTAFDVIVNEDPKSIVFSITVEPNTTTEIPFYSIKSFSISLRCLQNSNIDSLPGRLTAIGITAEISEPPFSGTIHVKLSTPIPIAILPKIFKKLSINTDLDIEPKEE